MENRQQALIQYKLAVSELEQTRIDQGAHIVPGTYVPLAKSRLDAARMLFLLDRKAEANLEVSSAERLLRDLLVNQAPGNPLPNAWLWRIYYLLGDVSLYESNRSIALFNYQQAEALNPSFIPASVMTRYLNGSVIEPQSDSIKPDSAGNGNAVPPLPPVSPNPETPAAVVPPQASVSVSNPTPTNPPAVSGSTQSASGASADVPTRPTTPTNIAQPTSAAKEQDSSAALYLDMEKISSSKALSKAADFVKVAAALIGTTELAPVAAALTLAGMIVDYAVQK